MTDQEKDVIPTLISTPFKTRSEADRKDILKARRPQPLLKSSENSQGNITPFDAAWYVTYKWLAGSTTNNRLYCWPCLLLSSSRKKIWIKDGYFDFRIFHATAESHALSKDHLKNSSELDKLDPLTSTANVSLTASKLAACCQSAKTEQNMYYKNNRLLLECLIRVTTALCKEGLAIYLLEKDTDDGVKFKQIFELVIAEEAELKTHCKKLGSIYTNMFSSILKDVIETISHEILYCQKADLKKAPFFSVQVDNALDVSGEFWHTVIVRYVDEVGDIQEHFLGFPLVCNERDRQFASGLFGTIEAVLGFNSYKEKMISFSLCGSSIQVKELDILKKKIISKAPEAMLIHSVAHRYEVVLQQGITFVTATQAFFATVESLVSVFKRTEHSHLILLHFLEELSPSHTSELHWSLNSKAMEFLLSERETLIDMFQSSCNNPATSPSVVIEYSQYVKSFMNREFVFLLLLFRTVFKVTDEFFETLQNYKSDALAWHSSLQQTLQKLDTLGRSSDTVKNMVIESLEIIGSSATESDFVVKCLKLYQSIIINISDQLKIRFADIAKLQFLQLTNWHKFASYKSTFPTEALESLQNAYGKHFKIDQLKEELALFIYSDPQFNCLNPPDIVKQLIKADLREIVPESYKLFSLVATLPRTNVRGKSCFQRLNAYLERNKTMGTFTARIPISVLMVQMPLLVRLEKTDGWYEKIINRFADEKKKHKIEIVP